MTEGEEGAIFKHVNDVSLSAQGENTVVHSRIDVTEIGSDVEARLAAYGVTWGYNAQLEKLDALLSTPGTEA